MNNVRETLTAVVFVKKSERFPGKHRALMNGVPIIDLVVSRLRNAKHVKRVLIYSRDPSVRSDLCHFQLDDTTGSIANSVLAALREFGDIFAIAGDMPCISSEIVDSMAQTYGGISMVPVHNSGLIEPLHAIYTASTATFLRQNIEDGKLSLREYISMIPHQFYRISADQEKHFRNVNYLSDIPTTEDCSE